MPTEYLGTKISTIITLLGFITTAYAFTVGKITSETMVWIIIGLILLLLLWLIKTFAKNLIINHGKYEESTKSLKYMNV